MYLSFSHQIRLNLQQFSTKMNTKQKIEKKLLKAIFKRYTNRVFKKFNIFCP